MAWVRNKKYVVHYLGDKIERPSIVLFQMKDNYNSFFDWKLKAFVTTQPTQIALPLILLTAPVFSGSRQRFIVEINTSSFADGDYCLIYLDGNGDIMANMLDEYFSVYQGSPEAVIPKDIRVQVTEEITG